MSRLRNHRTILIVYIALLVTLIAPVTMIPIIAGDDDQSGSEIQTITPILVCVIDRHDGYYRARFGYDNPNDTPIHIPAGENNRFSPGPDNRGQATSFNPGLRQPMFEVDFRGDDLTWIVTSPNGERRSVTANRYSIPCTDQPVPDPTEEPTDEPTPEPTDEPTPEPTDEPIPEPTVEPTDEPTPEPTDEPTPEPTDEPITTATPTATATLPETATTTLTPTATATVTQTATPTATATVTETATATATPTLTATPTPIAPECDFSIAPQDVAGLVTAIEQANLLQSASIICLSPGSTYTLTQAAAVMTGLPFIQSNISIWGFDATITRASSAGSFRIFFVNGSGSHLQLRDLDIINGSAGQGGAVFNAAGSLTASNTRFSDHNANSGGAIYNLGGVTTITGSLFESNTATLNGGGILSFGSGAILTVTNSTLSNNIAADSGGAIFHGDGSTSIVDSLIYQNQALTGGAIYNNLDGTVTINRTYIAENRAVTSGGETSTGGGVLTLGPMVTIQNSCLVDNVGSFGSSLSYQPLFPGPNVDARFNWWGVATGPPATSVSSLSTIDVTPFLTAAPDFCN
jgi:predicted outer membrane repeat protein